MTPLSTESTTARATAAWAGPNIWTACFAPLIVTLLKRMVSGFAGQVRRDDGQQGGEAVLVVRQRVDRRPDRPAPIFEPMIRSMCATSLPSPTSDSPMKKSAAIAEAPV